MVTRTPASAPWPPPVRIRHRGRRTGLDRRCLPRVPAGDRPGSIFHARSRQVSPTASSSHAIAKPIRRCRSGPWATRQALWPPPLRAEDRSLSIERKRNRRSYTITLHRNTVWSLSARVVRESRGRAKPPVLSPALAACDDG
jgi:hypothetical protein